MSSKQVVLITGSSTGFGRLFTETLARKGHTVFATMRDLGGRNAKNASEIRTLAQKDSLPIHVLELDVTDDASVARAVDAAVAKAGRIDVAINNAGYVVSGLAEAVTTEQAQRLMDTNFLGAVRVNRAVLPHMRRQRSGVLIHISSAAGRIIAPSMGFYCASKFALEAIVETPAGERQLRYFVSPQNFGVDEINALTKQVQANILEVFGLAADTKFLKGKAVGSV